MNNDISQKFNDAVADVLKRRAEIIDQFVKTWLAVNMPVDANAEWVINNCILCEKHIPGGSEFWLKFKDNNSEVL